MKEDPRGLSGRDRIYSLPWVDKALRDYQRPSEVDLLFQQGGFSKGGNLMRLIDSAALEDVQNRTTLFINPDGGGKVDAERMANWRAYLAQTKQTDRLVQQATVGLKFNQAELAPKLGITEQNFLDRGFLAAEVPQGFRSRIADGRIQLLENDIALADLRAYQSFDIIDMSNSLHILPPAGQQRALANAASRIREGGEIVIDDIGFATNHRVFPDNAGWLSGGRLSELSLERTEVINQSEFNETWVLTKV